MSFDVTVYFEAAPEDITEQLQAAFSELGLEETVLIPDGWEKEGAWYFHSDPLDKPDESFIVEVDQLALDFLQTADLDPEEKTMLAKARYSAYVSTRMGSGSHALMYSGAIARVTNGVMLDYQLAAFEKAFESHLAAHREPRGSQSEPTLVERGYYDSRLAWEIAKAAVAYEKGLAVYEKRQNTKASKPPSPSPAKPRNYGTLAFLGLLLLWALAKLFSR